MKLTMTLSEPLSKTSVVAVGAWVDIRSQGVGQLFVVVSISEDRKQVELTKAES